ncbi:MAG: porphobilinogen deaminase [Actinomycetes bacterium]|nr:MAG: porphobilinogen deaminase [Actinomycetes bacterium]
MAAAIGDAETVVIRTAGDEGGPTAPETSDKSRFVGAIEAALLAGEVDLAVHSAKDLPAELPDGLALLGVPAREDPADVWVGPGTGPEELAKGARVGTASIRRRSQLLALRGDLDVIAVRGNVDTRLGKLAAGEVDGLVLAAAGLRRLGRDAEAGFRFALRALTPAPGQGALALEGRAGDAAASAAAAALTDPEALVELTAERAAVAALGASCDTPVGVCARHDDDGLLIRGYAGLPDGSGHVYDEVRGDAGQPVALAEALVARMRDAGAAELLSRAASWERDGHG